MPTSTIDHQIQFRFNRFNKQKVDIIVPFHGQYASVRTLVESILRLTPTNEYKIYLVDDGSPNKFFNIDLPYVQMIRLPERQGFAAALEAGFNAGENPYTCFIHSDCKIVHPNWIIAMGETLLELKANNVRLVSSISNHPISDIPELTATKYEKRENKIVDSALPLFCFLTHRDLFKKIGGFIKDYPFFDDEELYWRMKSRGYKQAIAGRAFVHHVGGLTVETVLDIKGVMEESRKRCLEEVKKLCG